MTEKERKRVPAHTKEAQEELRKKIKELEKGDDEDLRDMNEARTDPTGGVITKEGDKGRRVEPTIEPTEDDEQGD